MLINYFFSDPHHFLATSILLRSSNLHLPAVVSLCWRAYLATWGCLLVDVIDQKFWRIIPWKLLWTCDWQSRWLNISGALSLLEWNNLNKMCSILTPRVSSRVEISSTRVATCLIIPSWPVFFPSLSHKIWFDEKSRITMSEIKERIYYSD